MWVGRKFVSSFGRPQILSSLPPKRLSKSRFSNLLKTQKKEIPSLKKTFVYISKRAVVIHTQKHLIMIFDPPPHLDQRQSLEVECNFEMKWAKTNGDTAIMLKISRRKGARATHLPSVQRLRDLDYSYRSVTEVENSDVYAKLKESRREVGEEEDKGIDAKL